MAQENSNSPRPASAASRESRSVKSVEPAGKSAEPSNEIERSTLQPAGADDRQKRITDAAYRRAEQRGFEPGAELDDWLAAEREIDGQSGGGAIG